MKKIKILLITPAKGLSAGHPVKPKFQSHPIGLLYIAGVLENNNCDVNIYDAFSFGNSLDDIKREASDYKPDLVGITAMTILAKDAYLIAKAVKAINPATVTVMGGPHATALPEEALKTGWIDIAVIGEGEYGMLDICNALSEKEVDFSDIKGIAYKDKTTIKRTPAREKIAALDELPFPSYDLLPLMKKYNPPPHWGKKGRFASVITSRGCPYGCMFCSVTGDWGRRYRFRSADNVLDELELLNKKYDVRYISFRDSVFTLYKRRVKEICKGMIERNLKLTWNCNGRVNEVNEETLSWMKKAGCKAIQFGLESGNEEILSRFKKLDKAKIVKAIEITNKAGIESHGYFMFGLPGETNATMNDTIAFAKSLKLHSAGFTSATPFPGSELWDYCVENNLILSRDWSKYDLKGLPPSRHLNLTADEILKAQKRAFRGFYLRPGIILNILKNINSLNDVLNYSFEAAINLINTKK